MTALTITIVAGFTVLLGEQLARRWARRRAIRRYARWWVERAAVEISDIERDYEAALRRWAGLEESLTTDQAGQREKFGIEATIVRPTVPPIGVSILGDAELLPDEVLQGLALAEAVLTQLGDDAAHLMRESDRMLGELHGADEKEAMVRSLARILVAYYRRTLAMAKAARAALDGVRAHF